jgi:type IV secretory pathway VirB2 component (pilin)
MQLDAPVRPAKDGRLDGAGGKSMSRRWIARGLAVGTALLTLQAKAFAAGGETLPFNAAFDKVTSNLTGPTAKAVIIAAFFAGIVGVMVSHDRPWMKNVGTVIAGGALLVGIPGFLDTLGISAAQGDFNWRPGFLLACGGIAMAVIVPLFVARALFDGQRRSS